MYNRQLKCPACNGKQLMAKYEAKYIYSYKIDWDSPGLKNTTEFLSFQYDSREQKESSQYIECNTCHVKYPVFFTEDSRGIDFKNVLEAISVGNSSICKSN
jgi:hypothetical protein